MLSVNMVCLYTCEHGMYIQPACGGQADTASPRTTPRRVSRQVLQFLHGVIAALAEVPSCAEQALQMFLTGAMAASEEARLEIIAYEFVEQVTGRGLRLVPGFN